MAKGFFQVTSPGDASYATTLHVTICMPRNEASELRKRIMCGLIFVLSTCGIISSGHTNPADALKRNQEES